MSRHSLSQPHARTRADSLGRLACPHPDRARCNRFAAGNLRPGEAFGKHLAVRLYCTHCGQRFSAPQGTLLQDSKLPAVAVVRILKCLMHGCSREAAADLCEVDPRTIERFLQRAGQRAADFQRGQLDRLPPPPEAVQLDELHARVAAARQKRGGGGPGDERRGGRPAGRVPPGCIARWP